MKKMFWQVDWMHFVLKSSTTMNGNLPNETQKASRNVSLVSIRFPHGESFQGDAQQRPNFPGIKA